MKKWLDKNAVMLLVLVSLISLWVPNRLVLETVIFMTGYVVALTKIRVSKKKSKGDKR